MSSAERKLTAELVRKLLDYDPATGNLHWKYDMRRVPADGVAGMLCSDGYRRIGINKKQYPAHRIVWLHAYGELPDCDIDHINHDRSDNRIENLRLATRSENVHAQRILPRNTSGYRGVHWSKEDKRWIAQIKIGGKGYHIGSFQNPEDASAAYQAASAKHFGEFAYSLDNASKAPKTHPVPQRSMPCPVGIFEAVLFGGNFGGSMLGNQSCEPV